jgi:hypothetical protein
LDLDDALAPKVVDLILRCAEAGIGVVVIDTLRSEEEHRRNVAAGVSWVRRSRHLPNRAGKAEAVDLAPEICTREKGWAPTHPHWRKMGEIGESLGLVWGGRWKVCDLGHFELPRVAGVDAAKA